MNGCKDYCMDFYNKCGEILAISLNDENILSQNKGFTFLHDYMKWIGLLSNRPETPLFMQASREYQSALLSLALGQYRQSFIGLRLCLELSLAGVLFSASEIELRTWLAGKRDILWFEIIDVDKGVFSAKFTRAFFEEMLSESPNYRTIAEKVYRECSEYVHGNADASNKLPTTLDFDQGIFLEWHEKAEIIRFVVNFALSCRYLHFLDGGALKSIEQIVIDDLGHLPFIRAYFGGSVGG